MVWPENDQRVGQLLEDLGEWQRDMQGESLAGRNARFQRRQVWLELVSVEGVMWNEQNNRVSDLGSEEGSQWWLFMRMVWSYLCPSSCSETVYKP